MLSSTGETTSVPGSKGAKPGTPGRPLPGCAKAMPASESSKTWLGGGSFTSREIWFRMDIRCAASNLDEGDLVNFLERGHAPARLLERRFAEECHALFASRAANFGGRTAVQNHFTDTLRQIQQFMDRAAAAESRATAFKTSGALVK